MKGSRGRVSAACLACGVLLAQGAHANVLVNPGFESGLSGWTPFGNVFAESVTPNSGTGVAKMFGNFSGGFNVSGLFQTFAASEGEVWSFDGYFRHNTGDALVGMGPPDANWVVMKFEFRDASDAVTGAIESTVLTGASPTDTWIDAAPISLTAPANTQSVWAFFLYLQPSFDGGAVLIDDASLVPAPSTAGLLAGSSVVLLRRRRRSA
jgi:zinc transporter ZupT